MYTVAAGGGPITRITTAQSSESSPSWSADGTHLIFTSDRGNGLNVYELRSTAPYGTAVNLTAKVAPCGNGWNGSWSSTGLIAFVACDPATGDVALYEMRPDGTGLRKFVSPSVPPTGPTNIYVAGADGSNFHKLISNGEAPSWQPVP